VGLRFELEARINYYDMIIQGVGLAIGIITFIVCVKNKGVVKYLSEVFGELLKVVWPDRESSVKVTIIVIIGVAIVSALLVLADFLFNRVLTYLY
jgi:preprotein translocase subunit SecE